MARPRNEFREAKKKLEAVQAAESRAERDRTVKLAGGTTAYNREKRRRERTAALDELVPDRHCFACQETKPESRQWVLVTWRDLVRGGSDVFVRLRQTCQRHGGKAAICRSCAMKHGVM